MYALGTAGTVCNTGMFGCAWESCLGGDWFASTTVVTGQCTECDAGVKMSTFFQP